MDGESHFSKTFDWTVPRDRFNRFVSDFGRFCYDFVRFMGAIGVALGSIAPSFLSPK